jgi:hypothetical protein
MKNTFALLFALILLPLSIWAAPIIKEYKTILDHRGGAGTGFQRVTVGEWQEQKNLAGEVTERSRSIICSGNGSLTCNGSTALHSDPNNGTPISIANYYEQLNSTIIGLITAGTYVGNQSHTVYSEETHSSYLIIFSWTGNSETVELNSTITPL